MPMSNPPVPRPPKPPRRDEPGLPTTKPTDRPGVGPGPQPIKPGRPNKPMPAPGGGIIGGWGAATPGGFNAESFIESRLGSMPSRPMPPRDPRPPKPGKPVPTPKDAARQQAIMNRLK